MENQYQGQLNYSHHSEDDHDIQQRKPHKAYQGTPGEKESYQQHHQRNSNEGSADVYSDSHPGTHEDDESQDLRRKGELNHAIFIKLQEISRYNIEIGNFEEGLVNYDRCIEHLLRTLPDGHSSSVFQEFLYHTVKSLNEVALKLLQEGKLKDSLLLLERCRKMTHPNSFGAYPTLRSLTYNHLGCCYRRIGKLDKALYYLEKAWEFIQGIEKVDTSGITHINLCAVLSQLGDHRKALDHAKMAVSDCAYDLIEATKRSSAEENHGDVNKKATMLAIAYHNLATEEEACKNPEAALQAYLRAFNLISEHNHPQHELCMKFGRAYEEARGRLVRPGQRRTMSPGGQQRKYGKSPPPNITVKRPPSLNTANKAAKAYLQNNKVVIPRRKVPPMNQSRPMTSHASPNNNPISNQKLYVPMVGGSHKKNERPVTAHPQSRTQHYQIHGVNETPQNGRPGTGREREAEAEAEENRPSYSEAGSEVEKLGLDDEDINQTDLKSNRLAFLQSLNQYNTHSNLSKGSEHGAQRNNFLADPVSTGEGDSRGAGKKSKKKAANKEVDPRKVEAATLKLQSFARGHLARQETARVMAEVPQPVFLILIAETMKGNLENGPMVKETLYYFLMMYELHSQIIHIHIKNLENKKFHKALVEYQVVNRTSKEAIIDELREACEKLIQHLEIHHDQIVFRDELGNADEGAVPEDVYMMGQDMRRGEPENVITEITERTDERTDESEGKIAGSRQGEDEDLQSNNDIRFSHNEERPVEEEVVDEIAEEDNKYEEEVFEEVDQKQAEKEKETPQEEEIDFDEEDQVEVDQEEDEKTHQPVVDTNEVANLVGMQLLGRKDKKSEESIIKIQSNIRGKLARDKYRLFKNKKFKVVFSRCLSVHGNILGFRLVESPSSEDQYGLFCYDFTKSKQFESTEIPKHLIHLSNLTVEELRAMLNFDMIALKVQLKQEFKDRKPRHSSKKSEKSESAGLSSYREEEPLKKQPSQESKRRSSRDHNDLEETLASVPLYFGDEKIDSTIHYNKKAEKILVKHGSNKKKPKVLEVPVSELEINTTEFSKPHFVNNMDILLLSRLSYKNGTLIYDKSPHAQVRSSKEDEKPPQKVEEEEELPDLKDPEVEKATLAIQNAYKKKKNKTPKAPVVVEEKQEVKEEKKETPKKEEEKDELPDLKDPEVEKATLAIQNAYKRKKNQTSKAPVTEEKQEQKKETPRKEEQKKESPRKQEEEEEELPDLKDPEVEKATLAIQNAYKKKKNKAQQPPAKPAEEKEQELSPRLNTEERGSHQKKLTVPNNRYSQKGLEEAEVSSPGLKDSNARFDSNRSANLFVNQEAEELYSFGKNDQIRALNVDAPNEFGHYRGENVAVESKEPKADSLPDLKDPEVEKATLTIQNAYKKKKNTPKKAPVVEEEIQEKELKEQKKETPKKEEEEEELPNLEDPSVQNATLAIQKAYKKKKDNQKKPVEVKEEPKLEEKEELPNIEDPEVQGATLKIQAAYKKKKDKQNEKKVQEEQQPKVVEEPKVEEKEELPNIEDPEVQGATLKIQAAYKKKKDRQNEKKIQEEVPKNEVKEEPKIVEEKEELPNIEDPEVQGATLKIQAAYKKKKDKQNEKKVQEEQQPKVVEEPKVEEEPKIEEEPKVEEKEELPNIEDPEVQGATLKIQAAYKKKKDRQNEKKTQEEVPKKEVEEEPKIIKEETKVEEKEELPNIEDPEVQGATLKIQAAYKKKKERANQKEEAVKETREEKKPEPEAEPEVKEKKVVEEEEELPDLNNPDVQNATLAIQKAYKKKQKGKAVPEPEPVVHKKEEEEEAYGDEFENESPSPVKEVKQEAKHKASEEPEFDLKKVDDEFDVFDQEEKEREQKETLKRPGTAKVEKPVKEVKPQDTDEDFELLDEEF